MHAFKNAMVAVVALVSIARATPLDVNLSGFIEARDSLIGRNNSGGSLLQWLPDVRLTFDPAFSSTSFNNAKCLAVDSAETFEEVLHLVFFDDREDNREIYYKRSTDGGTTWGQELRLTHNGAISHFPSISASHPVVHVAWEEYRDGNAEIYYKESPDAGVTWGADTRLTNNPANSFSPSVAAFDSHLHLTWFDQRDGNNEVYYKRSDDGGLTWNADTRLTNNPAFSVFPAITTSGSRVHIAWQEHRDGNSEIYYKRSSDAGITWGNDVRLTNNAANSFSPSIAAAGLDVHVAWFDQRDGNLEIYHKHSADAGVTWDADKRVTNNPAVSQYPSVSVSASNVHLVWFDERDGNTEIYYNRSTNSGTTWEADTRLTTDAARSTDPCVAVSSSTVHVAWTDARDNSPPYRGNYEIYYKSSDIGGGQTPTPTPTPTASATATATSTVTPTITPTATATSTPATSATPTATATPTSTPNQSATPTSTATPTATARPTPTPREALTPRPRPSPPPRP